MVEAAAGAAVVLRRTNDPAAFAQSCVLPAPGISRSEGTGGNCEGLAGGLAESRLPHRRRLAVPLVRAEALAARGALAAQLPLKPRRRGPAPVGAKKVFVGLLRVLRLQNGAATRHPLSGNVGGAAGNPLGVRVAPASRWRWRGAGAARVTQLGHATDEGVVHAPLPLRVATLLQSEARGAEHRLPRQNVFRHGDASAKLGHPEIELAVGAVGAKRAGQLEALQRRRQQPVADLRRLHPAARGDRRIQVREERLATLLVELLDDLSNC
mmetsp:Transcript_118602/g.342994  ORF Transcript_118602/g.342994 Transcript_118602/m.342994 type:complete len:268 (-) Transcript_118602:438-1241(-)